MKILYGVQATGQGHISRARAMAEAFTHHEVDVQWLFSGRERERLFDMEPFGDYLYRRGLTFTTVDGGIDYLRTVLHNNLFRFAADVSALDVSGYDLIVTDFEPVTAWAGRVRGIETIGIGHQYAFGRSTPKTGDHCLSRAIMGAFAPVDTGIGLHWDRFEQTTVPPILDLGSPPRQESDHVLVYLPFEDQERVSDWLQGFKQHNFIQYAPGLERDRKGNVQRHPTNIAGFKRDLFACRGVVCNSGFELSSECLQLGKPILTKPLAGQMEQLSNALALRQLGYATTMDDLCTDTLGAWLHNTPRAPVVQFPDVAAALADWLARGCQETAGDLSWQLWSQSMTPQTNARFTPVDALLHAGA